MKVTINGKEMYIDQRLKTELDEIKHRIQNKDEDFVIVVDGNESDGKSVLAMQIASYLDSTFCIDRICMNATQFNEAIDNASKTQAIDFDESFKGLSSRTSMSETNNILVSKMMQMRQKNLFVIIVLPTIFMLDRYVALFRSKALFHVYRNKGQRGYFVVFSKQKKKVLYLKGKKMFDYSYPKSDFKGRFTDFYPIDEQSYRDKKLKALEEGIPSGKDPKYLIQRDIFIYICYEAFKKLGKSQEDLAKTLLTFNFKLNQEQISQIITKIKDRYQLSLSKSSII